MPHTGPEDRPTRRWALGLAVGIALAAFLVSCQDPAGPPPTLEPGVVSFTFTGIANGSFTADGRCYWSDGYPAADSSCALALDFGDTLRIRAVRDPRTIRWLHVNVEFPEEGGCDAGGCRIAYDRVLVSGKVDRSFQATDATVEITEETEDRIRGTFAGLLYDVDGDQGDTIRINDGIFDVPVER